MKIITQPSTLGHDQVTLLSSNVTVSQVSIQGHPNLSLNRQPLKVNGAIVVPEKDICQQ